MRRERILLSIFLIISVVFPFRFAQTFGLFFAIGVRGSHFRRSLKQLFRLHPDITALPAVTVVLAVLQFVLSAFFPVFSHRAILPAVIFLLILTRPAVECTVKDSLCFSLAVLSGGILAAVVICLTQQLFLGFTAFFWCIYGWALCLQLFLLRQSIHKKATDRP